jgi:hypothetical protein
MVGIAKCMSLHLLLLAEVENKGGLEWITKEVQRSILAGRSMSLFLPLKPQKKLLGDMAVLKIWVEKLLKSENFEMALDEIVWLITLMANQSLLIHNLRNPDNKKPLLTQEEVELLTSPLELATYKNALTEAMFKGTKRNVESEDDSKNV